LSFYDKLFVFFQRWAAAAIMIWSFAIGTNTACDLLLPSVLLSVPRSANITTWVLECDLSSVWAAKPVVSWFITVSASHGSIIAHKKTSFFNCCIYILSEFGL